MSVTAQICPAQPSTEKEVDQGLFRGCAATCWWIQKLQLPHLAEARLQRAHKDNTYFYFALAQRFCQVLLRDENVK